jgi:predicted nucleotidyltransferase
MSGTREQAPQVNVQAMRDYFAQQPDIVVAYLFGSVSRGRAHRLSDVDVAVLFAPEVTLETSVERQLQLMGDLEAFADREVQVTVLNRATPLLAYQVIKYGIQLYERSRQARIEFQVRAMSTYFDFKPSLDFFDKVIQLRIEEGRFGYRRKRDSTTLDTARKLYERLAKASAS